MFCSRSVLQRAAVLALSAVLFVPGARSQLNSGEPQILSTGQRITPLMPQGARFQPLNPHLADDPAYTVGQAVTTAVSPDGKTLLILTSGFNLMSYTSGPKTGSINPADSTEFVFVFDISGGHAIQKQALPVLNTYSGIAFDPSGRQFYVAGGKDDDVHVFAWTKGAWAEAQSPVALGHLALANKAADNLGGLGLETEPMASGLAVSRNGRTIVVANYENDSVSILTRTVSGWSKSGELDLRPGVIDPKRTGIPGGEFPYWVSIKGDNLAYVSSLRDREIDVVKIDGSPSVLARIPVPGNPNRSVLNRDQSLLFVTQDNSDSVAVIRTATNQVIGEIGVDAPVEPGGHRAKYNGANPNSLALSPDEKTLYVTDGALNAVALVPLDRELNESRVAGLIPTGFYPNSVSVSADGRLLYIVNGKSANGPNPQFCHKGAPIANGTRPDCWASNQYDLQLTKAGFQTVPTPAASALSGLTRQVLENDHFLRGLTPAQAATMAELHKRIRHIIYIIKENRTYDQILGDLPVGNGDPSITQFGASVTPNFHAMAESFVDFDNFYDASEVSGDGWPWSTSGRTTDTIEKEIPVNYAQRGGSYNAEGDNRNVNVGIGDYAARVKADPLIALAGPAQNLLPGTANVAAPADSDDDPGQGYIWNAAHQAGLSVRNYGMFIDLERYSPPDAFASAKIPEDPAPFAHHLQVAYCSDPFLAPITDVYFRGFDNNFPDYFRFQEWNREFQKYDANGGLPALSLVRFMHDHTGSFRTSIDGVNTPELDIADNDYAVGLLIQAVAHSKRYKENTLIFVIEDDSQDGGDHVDAHRSTAFIIGPYVKHNNVDSQFYNTDSMLRTMEDILGTPHLNLNDASAVPMADAFDLNQRNWTYDARPSALLAGTTLPISASAFSQAARLDPPRPLYNAAWWARQTRGMDFSVEDHLDTPKYNRILWAGTMGGRPYPAARSGLDLRVHRAALLAKYYAH